MQAMKGVVRVLVSGFILSALLLDSPMLLAQEHTSKQELPAGKNDKPVRSPFESNLFIESQTTVVPRKKTLEFDIQHRFGSLNSGNFDLFGIYGPSNIRMGLTYTPFKRIQFGIGSTKNRAVQDFNWKWAILEQTRSGRIPMAITYYGNVSMEALSADNYEKTLHRLSYFNQIMLSRKFSRKLTIQGSFSFSHFNVVDTLMRNDNLAAGILARYKFSDQSSLMIEFDQPLTISGGLAVKPNLSVGIEVSTSSHAFQIFLTTYNSIAYQYNQVYNLNNLDSRGIRLGFNITRLWNY